MILRINFMTNNAILSLNNRKQIIIVSNVCYTTSYTTVYSRVTSRRSDYRIIVCVCPCLSQREIFDRKTMLATARELLCYCLHGR